MAMLQHLWNAIAKNEGTSIYDLFLPLKSIKYHCNVPWVTGNKCKIMITIHNLYQHLVEISPELLQNIWWNMVDFSNFFSHSYTNKTLSHELLNRNSPVFTHNETKLSPLSMHTFR